MPEKSSSLPRRGKTQSPLSHLAAWPAAVANLVRYALRRIREDRIAEAAGSLTFTTILAMVPLLIVIFALLTPFPVFDQMRETLHDLLLDNLVPPALSETILGYLNLYASKATNLTLFGLLGLGFTSLALILTIDHTLNTIWRVRRPRHLAQRLLIYIAVLTIGPVLLAASLGLTSYMFTLSGLGRAPSTPVRIASDWMPAVLSLFAFASLYRFVPNRRVAWRDAFIGAVAATLAFELAKRAFAIYVSNIAVYTTLYGALAVMPMFFLWIYVSWLITLAGAVMASGAPAWRQKYWKRPDVPGTPFAEALLMLRALWETRAEKGGNRKGERAPGHTAADPGSSGDAPAAGLTLDQVSRAASIDADEAEVLLERLEADGVVSRRPTRRRVRFLSRRRTEAERWVMIGDPRSIRLGELFRSLVYDGRRIALVSLDAGDPLVPSLRQIQVSDRDVSLHELFTGSASDLDKDAQVPSKAR